MSDVPLRLRAPRPRSRAPRGGDERTPAGDPFGLGALFGGIAGGGSPEDLLGKMPLFAELQKLMRLVRRPGQLGPRPRRARSASSPPGHQPTSQAEQTAVAEALRLADLWLDQVTELPSGIDRTAAWSRVDWVEKTLPAWGELIDPLAEKVVAGDDQRAAAGSGGVASARSPGSWAGWAA